MLEPNRLIARKMRDVTALVALDEVRGVLLECARDANEGADGWRGAAPLDFGEVRGRESGRAFDLLQSHAPVHSQLADPAAQLFGLDDRRGRAGRTGFRRER